MPPRDVDDIPKNYLYLEIGLGSEIQILTSHKTMNTIIGMVR